MFAVWRKTEWRRWPGHILWAESKLVLPQGPLCPPFLQALKTRQRCRSVSQTKLLPIKPGRTCQSQSATSLGSPSQASWQEGCQGSRSDERILNHIYMCMVQKGKGRGEKPLRIRNPKRKSLTNPPKKKKKKSTTDLSQMFSNCCP